jgi:hypothetical protein
MIARRAPNCVLPWPVLRASQQRQIDVHVKRTRRVAAICQEQEQLAHISDHRGGGLLCTTLFWSHWVGKNW